MYKDTIIESKIKATDQKISRDAANIYKNNRDLSLSRDCCIGEECVDILFYDDFMAFAADCEDIYSGGWCFDSISQGCRYQAALQIVETYFR